MPSKCRHTVGLLCSGLSTWAVFQSPGGPWSPRAGRLPREAVLWVTPTPGWLPSSVPETAGLAEAARRPGLGGLGSALRRGAKGCLPITSRSHIPWVQQGSQAGPLRLQQWLEQEPPWLGGAWEAPASLSPTGRWHWLQLHTRTLVGIPLVASTVSPSGNWAHRWDHKCGERNGG